MCFAHARHPLVACAAHQHHRLPCCVPSASLPLQSGPKASLYLTLVGILAGFMSTFWNLGYQRTSARMQVGLCSRTGPSCRTGPGQQDRKKACQG